MSDKIDLSVVEKYPLFVPDEHLLALVRAVRAAMALIHPTPEQLRDPMFLHRAGEGLRSELEAFTDSAEVRDDE